jgi:hypothetical protein
MLVLYIVTSLLNQVSAVALVLVNCDRHHCSLWYVKIYVQFTDSDLYIIICPSMSSYAVSIRTLKAVFISIRIIVHLIVIIMRGRTPLFFSSKVKVIASFTCNWETLWAGWRLKCKLQYHTTWYIWSSWQEEERYCFLRSKVKVIASLSRETT